MDEATGTPSRVRLKITSTRAPRVAMVQMRLSELGKWLQVVEAERQELERTGHTAVVTPGALLGRDDYELRVVRTRILEETRELEHERHRLITRESKPVYVCAPVIHRRAPRRRGRCGGGRPAGRRTASRAARGGSSGDPDSDGPGEPAARNRGHAEDVVLSASRIVGAR
jgi:hypothetical protein